MGRFDYVQYDKKSHELQQEAKALVTSVETFISSIQSKDAARAKSLAITNLEVVYMWIGKAIRDEQISLGPTTPQEERNNE